MELMQTIRTECIPRLQLAFAERPYDFLSAEIEAQVRTWLEVRKWIDGKLKINRKDPVPAFQDLPGERIRLEWGFEGNRHDLVVFRKDSDPQSYEDIELFIEVKYGWGIGPADHINHPAVHKDFELLRKYPEKGLLISYIGNTFAQMGKTDQEFYQNGWAAAKQEYGITDERAFMIFRDTVLK